MFVRTFRFLAPLTLAAATLALPAAAQDIAQGKQAYQSSTYVYGSFAGLAGYAVDGNTDGSFYQNSVSHTNADQNAWWYVDLGQSYNISSITLWNRTDCCGDRLSNFFVEVLAPGTPNVGDLTAPTTYSTLFTDTVGTSQVFNLPAGVYGQFIKIQSNQAQYVALAEVQTTGTPGTGGIVTTPEPSSMALLGTGLIGLVPMVRRRRNAA